MPHSWILDVLSDLDAYARRNDLTALAHHLTSVRQVAKVELSAVSGERTLVCIDGGAPIRAGDDRGEGANARRVL